jgi:hypothetical protein
MSNFEAGKTYKLSADSLAFIQGAMAAEFVGEDGVFKVAEVNDASAFSDDVTSPRTTERFSIPHFMADDCEEVINASNTTQ